MNMAKRQGWLFLVLPFVVLFSLSYGNDKPVPCDCPEGTFCKLPELCCRHCQTCAHGMHIGRACGQFHDQVCCEKPDMVVVDVPSGGLCLPIGDMEKENLQPAVSVIPRREGDSLTLHCFVALQNVSKNLHWEVPKHGRTQSRFISISSRERENSVIITTSTLTVHNITDGDFGEYRCSAYVRETHMEEVSVKVVQADPVLYGTDLSQHNHVGQLCTSSDSSVPENKSQESCEGNSELLGLSIFFGLCLTFCIILLACIIYLKRHPQSRPCWMHKFVDALIPNQQLINAEDPENPGMNQGQDTAVQELERLTGENGEQKDELKKPKEENGAQKDELEKVKKEQKDELQKVKEENGAQKDELEKVKEENGAQKDELKKPKEENGAQKDELEKVKEENGAQKDELEKLKEVNGKQKDELKKVKEENGKQKDELEKVKEENGKQKDELDKVKEENGKQKDELEKVKEENIEQNSKIKRLKHENRELKEEINGIKEADAEKKDKKIEKLKKKMEVMRDERGAPMKVHTIDLLGLEEKIESLKREIQILKREKADQQTTNLHLDLRQETDLEQETTDEIVDASVKRRQESDRLQGVRQADAKAVCSEQSKESCKDKVKTILELLRGEVTQSSQNTGDGFIPVQLLRCLNNLAGNDTLKVEIVEKGGLEVFEAMLKKEDSEIQAGIAECIQTLACNEDMAKLIRDHPSLDQLKAESQRDERVLMSN